MSEAKKYRCQIVTGYQEPGPGGSWTKTKKSDPFVVVATSPEEARIIMNRDHVPDYLKQLKRPKELVPEPNHTPWPLGVKQVIAVALKEAVALELMGAPTLFDLSIVTPPEPGQDREG